MRGVAYMLLISFVPASPSVVNAVEEIVVESTLETSSVIRIRLGISKNDYGDWRHLQQDLFRPLLSVTVRVTVGTVPVPETLINGYLTRQDITYADEPGSSTVEITGVDATHLMNLVEQVVPWPNLPDSAIATKIFALHHLVPVVQPTAPSLVEPEGTTMQRSTDLRFVRRLAKRNGFDFYVQPEPLTGVDQAFFRPRQTLGTPQAVLNVSMGSESNVAGFQIRYDMTQPTGALAAGLDTLTKAPQPALAPVSLLPPMGLQPALLRGLLPPPRVRPADTGAVRTAELQALVQGIVDRSSFAVVAEGEVGPDVGVLRPGGLVAVRGVGKLHNGLYLVTRVRHVINDDGYVQHFVAERNAVTMTGAEPYVDL